MLIQNNIKVAKGDARKLKSQFTNVLQGIYSLPQWLATI